MQSLVPRMPPINAVRLSYTKCIITNQQWSRKTLCETRLRPLLNAPEPDQQFGFRPRCFPHGPALAYLIQIRALRLSRLLKYLRHTS